MKRIFRIFMGAAMLAAVSAAAGAQESSVSGGRSAGVLRRTSVDALQRDLP